MKETMIWSLLITYDCQVFEKRSVQIVSGVMKQLVVHTLDLRNLHIHLLVLLPCHVLLLKS